MKKTACIGSHSLPKRGSGFSTRGAASLFTVTEAKGHIPPLTDIMNGVNVPCSTSVTLLLYLFFYMGKFQ